MARQMCSECPWAVKNKHNNNLIGSIIRWFNNGSRKSTEHRCHMISSDLWKESSKENVCIGSINCNKNVGKN